MGLEATEYTVNEDHASVNVCVRVSFPDIDCPIVFPFELDFSATPGTAGSYLSPMNHHSYPLNHLSPLPLVLGRDYRITDRIMRFMACAKMQCTRISITNDNLIEDTEMFTITVSPPRQGFTDDITISPSVATITIEDEDSMSLNWYLFRLSFAVLFFSPVAIVTFDRTLYEVQETSGRLTVCLSVVSPAVSCPVSTPFSVGFFVIEGSACNTP